jgi:hypothetical protein
MSDLWDDPDYFKLDWEPATENQLGLIYESRYGRLFLRQAGGMAFLPSTTCGFYVPLRDDGKEITDFFLKHPLDLLDPDQSKHVEFLKERLQHYGLSKYFEFRTPLLEAFTSIEIVALDPAWPPEIRCGSGILTWPNCD